MRVISNTRTETITIFRPRCSIPLDVQLQQKGAMFYITKRMQPAD